MKDKRDNICIKDITKGSSIKILVILGLIASVVIAGCIDGGKNGKITPIPTDTSIVTPKGTPKGTPEETPEETPGIKTLVVRKGDKASTNTPITIDMSIPLTLSSNNVAEVNIMVKSANDAPNTKVDLNLPEGVSLVSNKSTWDVNLTKNVPVNLSAKIKIETEGELEISAVANKFIDEDNSWGDIDVAYIGFEDVGTTPGKIE